MVVCVKRFLVYVTCVTLHKISNFRYQTISSLIISSQLKYWLSSVNHHNHITEENHIIQCAWRHALKAKMNLAWWPSHTGLLTIPLVLHEWFQDQYRAEDDDNMANNSENGKIMMIKGAWWWNNGQITMMVTMKGKWRHGRSVWQRRKAERSR